MENLIMFTGIIVFFSMFGATMTFLLCVDITRILIGMIPISLPWPFSPITPIKKINWELNAKISFFIGLLTGLTFIYTSYF